MQLNTTEKNAISLPEVYAGYSAPLPPGELLLAGGGRAPAPNWLCQAASGRQLWCIDRGIDCCHRAGLVPLRLIGDGDSATEQSWQWAEENKVPIAKFPVKKDYTDTQLALEMAAAEQKYVVLTGAMGGRFDHAYSTIFSFGHSNIQGCIADEQETVFFLRGKEKITLTLRRHARAISLLPLTAAAYGVTIQGVYWPLQDAELTQGLPYAVSNEAAGEKISIALDNGILAVYICWQEDKLA